MQVDLIRKLYNKYNFKDEMISKDLMNKLLQEDNKLIESIINSNKDLSKIENYFNDRYFKLFDTDTKILILEKDDGSFYKLKEVFDCINEKIRPEILSALYECPNKSFLDIGIEYLSWQKKDDIKRKYISDLFKIILNSPTEKHAIIAQKTALCINANDSGKVVELTSIVANAKTGFNAEYAYYVIRDIKGDKLKQIIVELASIIANANTDDNAKYACYFIRGGISRKICPKTLELTKLYATINPEYLSGVKNMVEKGFSDVVFSLLDTFKSDMNANNFNAILNLLLSGEYEKSNNPITSFEKILKSTDDYIPFGVVYDFSDIDAVKGAEELNKEFPGIDIKSSTYIKTRKSKKTNNKKN